MAHTRRHFFLTCLGLSAWTVSGCNLPSFVKHTGKNSQVLPDYTPALRNHGMNGAAVIEGRTLVVELVSAATLAEVKGRWSVEIEPEIIGGQKLTEPQPLYFYQAAEGKVWRAILSAPLDVVAAVYPLTVEAVMTQGATAVWQFPYEARQGTYRNSRLTLNEAFSNPPMEAQIRQKQEFAEIVQILRRRTAPYWQRPFIWPTEAGDADNFGDKRIVNQTKHYRHAGLDMHAPLGTPVRAVNDGEVVLAKEQWTAGQSICLDHGGGIFSKYAHLSELHVTLGASVAQGQVIALSGNTGSQKPAPHLHFDIIINGTHVDPRDFMQSATKLLQLDRADAR